jgi:hypothetical protein
LFGYFVVPFEWKQEINSQPYARIVDSKHSRSCPSPSEGTQARTSSLVDCGRHLLASRGGRLFFIVVGATTHSQAKRAQEWAVQRHALSTQKLENCVYREERNTIVWNMDKSEWFFMAYWRHVGRGSCSFASM